MENKKEVIKAEFITMRGEVFARGEYKTMKAMRRSKDKYDLKYGAILRTRIIHSSPIGALI